MGGYFHFFLSFFNNRCAAHVKGTASEDQISYQYPSSTASKGWKGREKGSGSHSSYASKQQCGRGKPECSSIGFFFVLYLSSRIQSLGRERRGNKASEMDSNLKLEDRNLKRQLEKVIKKKRKHADEFYEGLVAIGADVAFSVDDLAEWLAKLDKFLLRALPRQVTEVQNLRWGLRVTELRLTRRRRRRHLLSLFRPRVRVYRRTKQIINDAREPR